CQIAIALADTNRLIGDIGICLDADGAAAEIGITLSPARQHSGLAGEATILAFGWIFATCPATRIYGIADQRNIAAVDFLDRLGMVFEDEYETEFEGEPCIEIRHSMVRERFMELQKEHQERRG
ncbi:MAG: GNAT family N-acetyltransferase, partial [Rhizobiaceae bacterium]